MHRCRPDARRPGRDAPGGAVPGDAAPPSKGRGLTSDLSVDEALLLHAAGWEPLDLVCGVAVVSVPVGVWNWGRGAISLASEAHDAAVDQAAGSCAESAARSTGTAWSACGSRCRCGHTT